MEADIVIALVDVGIQELEHLAFELLAVVVGGFQDTRMCPNEVNEVRETGTEFRVNFIAQTMHSIFISFREDIARHRVSWAAFLKDAHDH